MRNPGARDFAARMFAESEKAYNVASRDGVVTDTDSIVFHALRAIYVLLDDMVAGIDE